MAKRKKKQAAEVATSDAALLGGIRELIERGRQQTARAVNSALVGMYWHIGRRICQDVLENDRAEYGEEIVQTLSAQLTEEYGRGFGRRNLFQMIRFFDVFPDERIVQTLSAQLSWSHFVELIPHDDPFKRDYYAEMCRVERWSVRTLRHKIGHLLFERTAVSKKSPDLIEQDITALRDENRLTPDELRDEGFIFQVELELQSDTFIARPNLRSLESEDWDERVADLQYRHAFEFSVGYSVSTEAVVEDGGCRTVRTCRLPTDEVEKVAPSTIPNVTLEMEALGRLRDERHGD